ncbi:hypothetical protein [Stigmatella aurantiaca]|uniref:Uncharacterized protein n=1 Tax=Stigmatella aurantiaca (strain DW4/3-1) TaxID=378806 RepID=Q08WH8_STIAD|nr:hypothetical protein [Stigmatella aurantiaca]ADO69823.1 uncharacterized protein STAUR_2019 [Stigmatella aurantiaca DW4/3-1]EAU64832.1 hypothetical protein STIAU_2342 [Stigmatella aurantiaca DW4/3-1]
MSTQVKLLLSATVLLSGTFGFLLGRGTAPAASGQEEVLREIAGLRTRLDAHLTQERPTGPPPEVRCAVASPVDAAALKAELAKVLREELGTQAQGEPVLEPQPPPALSPQAVAAHQQAQRILEEATRTRRWSDEDARSLRRALVDMTDAQREEVVRRLITTLNSNTLDVQTQGMPF